MANTSDNDYDVLYIEKELKTLLSRLNGYDGASVARYLLRLAMVADKTTDTWQPIETAPKDGTVILFQEDFPQPDGSISTSISTCYWRVPSMIEDSPCWELVRPGDRAEDDRCQPVRWAHVPGPKNKTSTLSVKDAFATQVTDITYLEALANYLDEFPSHYVLPHKETTSGVHRGYAADHLRAIIKRLKAISQ